MNEELKRIVNDRLHYMSTLKDGWYNNEGIRPSLKSISEARVLFELQPSTLEKCSIFPSYDGGLELILKHSNQDECITVYVSSIGNLRII